ncbi:MAG: GAF domain-containing protein [Ardenticatenales bacterium]|nr:GAF domain-containing protein [Ardenticatenales bacterium]
MESSVFQPQTAAELAELTDLVDELSNLLDLQNHTMAGTTSQVINASSEQLIRLLIPMRTKLNALENRLRTESIERQQLEALQTVGAAVNSSLELKDVLNTVMDSIINLTGAERSFLMLFNASGNLEVRAARNMDRTSIEDSAFEYSRSIVDKVAATGEPIVTTDAQDDPRFAAAASIVNFNIRSILCVPLKLKGHVTGVIYADNRATSGIFGVAERDLLNLFADQAATAIVNANLFLQIREHLDSITEMKNLMDDVFESIASGVITVDIDDQISLINQAATEILALDGHSAFSVPYSESLAALLPELERLVGLAKEERAHHAAELDIRLPHRPGTTTLNLTCSPLQDAYDDIQGIAIVVDDLTEKKRLDSARRYLPPALVDRIRDIDAAQQPQRREISTVFADIRGFSTFSEKLEPEALVQVINQYFTIAAECINRYEGVIDKFMGDAVMATYNTTLNPQENDHIERAVHTGLALIAAVRQFNAGRAETDRLHFGVGIHVGDAVVGNVGSAFRKDYSAIGDAVNIAKRLQENAKAEQILASEQIIRPVAHLVEARALGKMTVKGRAEQVIVYELLSLKNAA